jgi:hypothetical protein
MPMFNRCFSTALLAGFALAGAQTLDFQFESDSQGWVCDFADYPKADSANWHLQYKVGPVADIVPKQNGMILKGDNFSDDLFFFLKKEAVGLAPNTTYTLVYSIDVATNAAPDMIGGSDLMLKAGASLLEPRKALDAGGMYRMNIDKGNQSRPGPDMDTLGHVNHSEEGVRGYRLATFTNAKRPFKIKTDAQGKVWLIVGAESQFETPAEFLVAAIRVTLSSPTGILESKEKSAMGKNPGRNAGFQAGFQAVYQGADYSLSGRRALQSPAPRANE